MLIRTQDRETLVNLSSLTMIRYNRCDKSIDGFFKSGGQCILGVYKSKKRCKEVLDAFQRSFGMDWDDVEGLSVVFEMPEE